MFVSDHLNSSLQAQGGEESAQQHKPPIQPLASAGGRLSLHSVNSPHHTLCPMQVGTAVTYMEMELIHHQTTIFLTLIKNRLPIAVSHCIQTQCCISMLAISEPSGVVCISVMTYSGEATRFRANGDEDEPRKKPTRENTTFTDSTPPSTGWSNVIDCV